MRWHYRDPLLAWLLPAAYALHILEEWALGFPEWLRLVAGATLPRPVFVVINTLALAAMVLATRAAVRREERGWMGVGIATILLINGIAHVVGTLVTGRFSPGMVTGVVLYLPLGQLVLFRAWSQARGSAFSRGVLSGFLVHLAVSLVALVLARAGPP